MEVAKGLKRLPFYNFNHEKPCVLAHLYWYLLQGVDGILVPGGFGDRGVEGKILAAKYARENKIPFLGICLGMQIAVIEFARSVLSLQDANSTEFNPETKHPCIIFMPEVLRFSVSILKMYFRYCLS